MPNWTQNRLVILVPTEHLDALVDEIQGPAYWPTPELAAPINGIKFTSAHAELEAKKNIADPNVANELRDEYRKVNALADWVPVSSIDVLLWLKNDKKRFEHFDTVPFSIPKIAPLKNETEFYAFYAGEIDAMGYWKKTTDAPGAIGLCNARIGVKWPPGSQIIEIDHDGGPDPYSVVTISYDTPWAPIESLNDLLEPILEKYEAKAALTWEEEDSNSGWNYINPNDESRESHFEHGQFVYEAESGDEDDDLIYHEWDHEGFIQACLDAIEDSDFNHLL